MSSLPSVIGKFFSEPLPPEAATGYRAFRALLPYMVITGTVRAITLTAEGKLAMDGEGHVQYIPKDDVSDQSESHFLLAPGGTISPELIAEP